MTATRSFLLIALAALAVISPVHAVEKNDGKTANERFYERVRNTPTEQLTDSELRKVATIILEDLRMLDASIDQWAIENNKIAGDRPELKEVAVYHKRGTRLQIELSQGLCRDILGNPVRILVSNDAANCSISKETVDKLAKVAPSDFWGPFLAK